MGGALDLLAVGAIPASALLWGLLVNRPLAEYAESPYKKQRRISAAKRKEILSRVGADPTTPVISTELAEHSGEYYVPPSEIDTAMEFGIIPPYKSSSPRYKSAKKHGVIAMRKKPTEHTLAHEAGHAADVKEGAWSWPRILGRLGMVAAPIAGYAGSMLAGPKGFGAASLGALALAAPELWSEFKASYKADKHLAREKHKWPARRRLGAAFATYLGSVVPTLAAGGVGLMRHYNPQSRAGFLEL